MKHVFPGLIFENEIFVSLLKEHIASYILANNTIFLPEFDVSRKPRWDARKRDCLSVRSARYEGSLRSLPQLSARACTSLDQSYWHQGHPVHPLSPKP